MDNIRLRYGMRPKNLADRCNGCGCGFTLNHAMSCKVGGLVGRCHDDQRDEAGALCAMATTESRVSYEPMIYYGTGVNAGQRGDADTVAAESNGDLAMRLEGMWQYMDCSNVVKPQSWTSVLWTRTPIHTSRPHRTRFWRRQRRGKRISISMLVLSIVDRLRP